MKLPPRGTCRLFEQLSYWNDKLKVTSCLYVDWMCVHPHFDKHLLKGERGGSEYGLCPSILTFVFHHSLFVRGSGEFSVKGREQTPMWGLFPGSFSHAFFQRFRETPASGSRTFVSSFPPLNHTFLPLYGSSGGRCSLAGGVLMHFSTHRALQKNTRPLFTRTASRRRK